MVTIGLPLGNCDISYKWSEVYTPDSSPVYCLTCTYTCTYRAGAHAAHVVVSNWRFSEQMPSALEVLQKAVLFLAWPHVCTWSWDKNRTLGLFMAQCLGPFVKSGVHVCEFAGLDHHKDVGDWLVGLWQVTIIIINDKIAYYYIANGVVLCYL